jgi:hypothetical protein
MAKWTSSMCIDAQALFDSKDLEANQQGLTSYEWPCTCYYGIRRQTYGTIKKLLRQNGQTHISNGQWWYGLPPLIPFNYEFHNFE